MHSRPPCPSLPPHWSGFTERGVAAGGPGAGLSPEEVPAGAGAASRWGRRGEGGWAGTAGEELCSERPEGEPGSEGGCKEGV